MKKPVSRIKSGPLSRGLALAKVTFSVGAKAASSQLSGLFSSESERAGVSGRALSAQAEIVARELGRLKGSLMKVGQLLSTYGEHFLPPEANVILKSLQQESPPLEWKEIQKVLRRQLGSEKLNELQIDPAPIASASLGQVHRAVRKSDGKVLAIKIQYPGVEEAITSDLKTLKTLLRLAHLIPKGPRYDEVFLEIEFMLRQEVDYVKELETTLFFRKALAGDPRYVIPEPFPQYSSARVITTSLEPGLLVDGPEVAALSQERRNLLARSLLELYFRELFEFRAVQTDPHFGNYRVRVGEAGLPDALILFDFGAVRRFSEEFLSPYRDLVRGACLRDLVVLQRGAMGLGVLRSDDSPELRQHFSELCFLITEPFSQPSNGIYDWGVSDLPKRVARKGAEMVLRFQIRVPPRETVFLDRKMGGVFVFVSVLKARIESRDLLFRYLGAQG